MIKAVIMGYGTIGSGVAEILKRNCDGIAKQAGQEIQLSHILDLRTFPGDENEELLTRDFSVIENDEQVKLVVETMGGLHPAYEFVKRALLAGKHVITSNKALVAAFGTELLELARKQSVNFFFEASVGGGIPVIRPLAQSYAGEKISGITGILNGTTNFILTRMQEDSIAFEDALKEAQELGYAEKDPSADIEGYDTCRKIAILLSMATGKEVDYQDIYTEGISKITNADFAYAEEIGRSVRLLGCAEADEEGRLHAWVAPMLISEDSMLWGVRDVFNAVILKGTCLGDTMLYGSGAGKLPTASAVISDMIEAARHLDRNETMGWGSEKAKIQDLAEVRFCYFIRIRNCRDSGKVRECFAVNETWPEKLKVVDSEIGLVTGEMTEDAFKKARRICAQNNLGDIVQVIRMR